MKRFISTMMILSILALPMRSHALVVGGCYLANKMQCVKVFSIAGGAVAATPGAAWIGSFIWLKASILLKITLAFASIYLSAGVILLNENGNLHLEYQPLAGLEEAEIFGITDPQMMESYNAHVDSLNVIFSDIAFSSEGLEGPDYAQMWRERYDVLEVPREAQEALALINQKLFSTTQ